MHIILNHSSMVPIYEQLMEQIKSEIINTALKRRRGAPIRPFSGRGTADQCADRQKGV